MSTKYTFDFATVSVAQTSIHPIVKAFGFDFNTDDLMKAHFNHFNKFYDKPVAIKQGEQYLVVTQTTDFKLLQESGAEEIELYVTNINDEFELRRFIGFRHAQFDKNWIALYDCIKFLEKYLKTKNGKVWSKSIPKQFTRPKIAYLMGLGEGTIERIKYVGDNAPQLLGLINQGNYSYKQAEDFIYEKKQQEKAAAKAAKKAKENNKPAEKETKVAPLFPSTLESLSLSFHNGTPVFSLNGQEFTNLLSNDSLDIKPQETFTIKLKDGLSKGLEVSISIKNLRLGGLGNSDALGIAA